MSPETKEMVGEVLFMAGVILLMLGLVMTWAA